LLLFFRERKVTKRKPGPRPVYKFLVLPFYQKGNGLMRGSRKCPG
jgi:hypothetical protein